jgi:hypothetical protein
MIWRGRWFPQCFRRFSMLYKGGKTLYLANILRKLLEFVALLQTSNEALLMQFLHMFFNREDIPWAHLIWKKYYANGKLPNHAKKGSFWWKDVPKLLDKFKAI